MSTLHAIYGELLTAKEVCDFTGFTMNQLRNWRIPARRSLAPFGFVSIGATPFYRKVVIQDYLDEQGPQQGVYVMSDRDKKFPIAVAESLSLDESMARNALGKLTAATVDSWINGKLNSAGLAWVTEWKRAWAAIETALGLEPNFTLPQNRWDNPEWWNVAVHAARYLINEEQALGLPVEKVLAIGGSHAPVKELKF
jgi:hypothetical protein